jgi:hypothetical protein
MPPKSPLKEEVIMADVSEPPEPEMPVVKNVEIPGVPGVQLSKVVASVWFPDKPRVRIHRRSDRPRIKCPENSNNPFFPSTPPYYMLRYLWIVRLVCWGVLHVPTTQKRVCRMRIHEMRIGGRASSDGSDIGSDIRSDIFGAVYHEMER